MERYNLSDTIDDMLSDDWKKRLRAEFLQTDYRCNKLVEFLESDKAKTLIPKQLHLLKQQRCMIENYLSVLTARIVEANIDVSEYI